MKATRYELARAIPTHTIADFSSPLAAAPRISDRERILHDELTSKRR